jgi:hypothetical protein
MEMCDVLNEDFAISQTAQGAKIEKYVIPKFGTKTTARLTGLIKKGATRNSTLFHHHPKRSHVKKAKKVITKTEVIRPSLPRKQSIPHQKALMVANNQLQCTGNPCDIDVEKPKAAVVTTKQDKKEFSPRKACYRITLHFYQY